MRSPGRRPDRGFTLVELTVAMAVGALRLAASATAFVAAVRAVRTVDVSTSAVADARRAMEAMTRTMRVAWKPADAPAAVIAAGPQRVRFWALLNRTGAPAAVEPPATLVEYAWDGACLTESQTREGRTVVTCLVRTGVPPAFAYFANAAATVDGAPVAALPSSPSVADGDLPGIRSIQVALTVTTPGDAGTAGVPVLTRVTLQNLVTS